MNVKIKFKSVLTFILSMIMTLTLCGCDVDFDDAIDIASGLYDAFNDISSDKSDNKSDIASSDISDNDIMHHKAFNDQAYVVINDNTPFFDMNDYIDSDAFESYSDLDKFNRPGVAFACLSQKTMPGADEERGSISHVKPVGFLNAKYDNIDNGGYLYNRCHLIGWQLSAENDNKQNLITGTRYLNINGMLDYENQIADYLYESKNNKVLYRVTPVYEDDNLVCEGLLLEAMSFDGDIENNILPTVQFCIFCYNVQPGIVIDYGSGASYKQ